MSRRRIEFEPARADDKALVRRIGELLEARRATEAALAEAVNEYSLRRVKVARVGQAIVGPLAEPIAPSPSFQQDQFRREQVARQHFEADEALRRDPRSKGLVTQW